MQVRLQPQQFILHLPADQRVQAAERFVHQEDVGVHRQCPGQSHALLHAAGQLARVGVFPTGQTDQRQDLFSPGVAFRLAHALDFQAPTRVVQHVPMRLQTIVLEHHGDFLAAELHQLLVGHSGDVLAVNNNVAGGWLDEADQAPHHGGLPAAGQPHDDEGFATIDGEGDILESHHVAELALEERLVLPGILRFQDSFRISAEYLPDRADADERLAVALADGGIDCRCFVGDHSATPPAFAAGEIIPFVEGST